MRPSLNLIRIVVALVVASVLLVAFERTLQQYIWPIWALFGAVAVLDLMMSVPARRIAGDLDLPETAFTGTTATVDLSLSAKRGAVPDGIEARLQLPDGLTAAPMHAESGPVGAPTARIIGALQCNLRGSFDITRLWLRWSSNFGLFDVVSSRAVAFTIKVMPNITPVLSGQINTQMQPLLLGIKDAQLRGSGSEFHQLRDFGPGMDPRSIDWKRSASRRSLVARETHAERNHQIIFCLDNGHLMREKIGDLPKIDRAIHAALAMCWAAGLGGDRVGLFSFDSRPRLFVPPAPGRTAFANLRLHTASMTYSSVESNHTLAMSHLNSRLSRRSLIVVFSDFVDSTTAELLVENVGVLSRHHLMLYVSLRDPDLNALAEPETATLDSVARSVSAAQILRERQMVLDRLRRLGVICLDTTPDGLTPELVSTYIDIKAREMI